MTKFGGTEMRGSLSNRITKIQSFNHFRQTHKIFKKGKYEETKKCGKIWRFQNEVVPLKRSCQNSNFFTS